MSFFYNRKPELSFRRSPWSLPQAHFGLFMDEDLRFPRWFGVWVKPLPTKSSFFLPREGRWSIPIQEMRRLRTEGKQMTWPRTNGEKRIQILNSPFLCFNQSSYFLEPVFQATLDLNLYCKTACIPKRLFGRIVYESSPCRLLSLKKHFWFSLIQKQ